MSKFLAKNWNFLKILNFLENLHMLVYFFNFDESLQNICTLTQLCVEIGFMPYGTDQNTTADVNFQVVSMYHILIVLADPS